MPNAWVAHVKKCAKEKGLSYMCAATDEDCKRTYRELKPPKPPKAKKAAKQAEPILDKKARAKARINPLIASLREALAHKMDKKAHEAHLEIEKAVTLKPDDIVFGKVIERLNTVIDRAPKANRQKLVKALGAWAKEFMASHKQSKAAEAPKEGAERGYVNLDDGSTVEVKPFEIDGDDDDYFQDAKGNIYDYKDDRVGIIEDGAPVLFTSVLDETLNEMAETDAILDRMLFIISKSPKKYPEVVDYITTIQDENLKPELYEKYANMTSMQKKIYQLAKESFPAIRIMDDEGTDEMSHYAIRFSWHKSSKDSRLYIKNVTVDDYTSSGDGKDIAELRLSSTLKPGTAKVRSVLVKMLAELKPAKKPRAKATPKAKAAKAAKPKATASKPKATAPKAMETIPEEPAAPKAAAEPPKAKPKKSAAAQGVLGNKDILGMIKSYTNEFSPAELAALKKKYDGPFGFTRDRFGNIVTFYEHIGDIRIVEINNKPYNLRKDSEEIEEPKPRHKEFKEYAKMRRVRGALFERIAAKHGLDGFRKADVQKEYRDGLIKIAKFYVMGNPPPAKRLSPDKQRRLDRAKQQLAQMDQARAMGMMMDEDRREEIEDTVYELELETIL
jgi:hypothetical protein